METDRPNPFLVLRLATDASKREIIERAQELYDTAESEEKRQLYNWAKEQLISHPEKRLAHELFEYPDTRYDDPLLEQFARRYRNAPISLEKLIEAAEPLSLEQLDMVVALRWLVQSLLEVPEAEMTTALADIPFPVEVKSPLEVRDVIFG
ncbi:MAG TPA: hypothetical protein VFV38_02900 [Ktedonobacteraceae bacterium]|nr:hypothetical protein [Ktedonobacteraceae bacterium]